jgi:hypothetical protein
MKIRFLLWFLFVVFTTYSQNLSIPNTPAFSILGYEPSSIMRPNNYKQLSSDILNSFDENGDLKINLGMEVSPYWLKSRSELTRSQYLNAKGLDLVKQTFMLSAASVRDTISNKDNLGFGFKTHILRGKVTKSFYEKNNLLEDFEYLNIHISSIWKVHLRNIKDIDGAILKISDLAKSTKIEPNGVSRYISSIALNEVIEKAKKIQSNYSNDKESITKFCMDLSTQIMDSKDELAQEIIELENKRIGVSLEIAGAGKFITNPSSSKSFEKMGFWVNLNNFFTEEDAWTITGRVFGNANDTLSINTDVGIGYIKVKKDYSISIEGMLRWYRMEIPTFDFNNLPITSVERDFTYRLASQISYKVTNDISVNFNIGKDFNSPKLTGSTFFSMFGINYSLFEKFGL